MRRIPALLLPALLLILALRPSPTAAQPSAPAFEDAACPVELPSGQQDGRTVRCGFVSVPEDRGRPGGHHIRLAVAVFKARTQHPDPVPTFYLAGGPGSPGLEEVASRLRGRFATMMLRGRDLVVVDQRGTGYSTPSLDCPEISGLNAEHAAAEGAFDQWIDRAVVATRDCRTRLTASGVDLAAYTSAAAAADLNDVRRALGYEQVNLYGVSYGTRLALAVVKDYPQIVRAAVLDAVLPPQTDWLGAAFAGADRAIAALFRACAADDRCTGAFPDLEARYWDKVEQLNTQPSRQIVPNRRTGDETVVEVTGDHVVALTFELLYVSDLLGELPYVLDQIARDNLASVAAGIAASTRITEDEDSEGLYLSVVCSETVPFTSPAEHARLAEQVRPALRSALAGDDLFPICDAWHVPPVPADQHAPVVSAVPTLLLAGEFDPVTPFSNAALARTTLANGYAFEFPGMSHGLVGEHACPTSITAAFFNDPTIAPDATCIESMPAPAWRIRRR